MRPVGRWVWLLLTPKSPQPRRTLAGDPGTGCFKPGSHLCCPQHDPWLWGPSWSLLLGQLLLTHPAWSRGSPMPSDCPSCDLWSVSPMHPLLTPECTSPSP